MNFTAQNLSTITARNLVVNGDWDNFFPVEIAVNIYRFTPTAALWIIPGGDHVPIYDSIVPFKSSALRFLEESEGNCYLPAEIRSMVDIPTKVPHDSAVNDPIYSGAKYAS